MATPVIVFGAFDRHNLGDLLFPHIVQTLLHDRPCIITGLARRDLSQWGGHQTLSLTQAMDQTAGQRVHFIHAGGELLTCSNWDAAVMLQNETDAAHAIARYEPDPGAREQWAATQTGSQRAAPYAVPPSVFRQPGRWIFNAVGGIELAKHDVADTTLQTLRAADFLGVRDRVTLAALQAAGIAAHLLPDSAVLVRHLFQYRIAAVAQDACLATIRANWPNGYLAVQFSADFADDATLDQLARQLQQFAVSEKLGIVLFRAGAAPWHDDLEPYRRLLTRLPTGMALIYENLNIWNICALLAASRLCCGSSLHGRIVAMAYGLPRVNLRHPTLMGKTTKQSAYAETWEIDGMPHCIGVEELGGALQQAMAMQNDARLTVAARAWEDAYLRGAALWQALLD